MMKAIFEDFSVLLSNIMNFHHKELIIDIEKRKTE